MKPIRMIIPFAPGGRPDIVGRAGVGNASHLAMKLFVSSTGTRFLHVPYNGNAPGSLALVAGHAQVMFNNVQTTPPYVKSGKLRRLGVGDVKRMPMLPDIPASSSRV